MQGAEVAEGWSVDQLWLRVGSENLRFSSRGSVFLILAQRMVLRDLIPDFGMRVKSNVLCVRRGFGRLETFECSNLLSEWLQLPHIHRTIDHRTFPNIHPLALYRNKTLEPAYQSLQVDLDHQRKRGSFSRTTARPAPRTIRPRKRRLQYILTTKVHFHFL